MLTGLTLALLLAPPAQPPGADDFTSLLYHFEAPRLTAGAGLLAAEARLAGGRPTPGRFGGGLDPRAGGLVIDHPPALNVTDGLTIECWVRVDGPADELQRIAFRSGVYGLYTDPGGTNVTFYANVAGQWTGLRASLPPRQWAHVAGTFDGETLQVLVDGEVRARQAIRGTIAASAVPLEVGGEAGPGRRRLNGAIDELRLSTIARTDFDRPVRFEPTLTGTPTAIPEAGVPFVRPTVAIGRAAAAPRLDGQLDDATWAAALQLDLLDSPAGAVITQPTQAWLAWDDTALYVAARCTERQMDRLRTAVGAADGRVWTDDAFELLLQPAGAAYYHLAVNPRGVLYDARVAGQAQPAWSSGATLGVGQGDGAWTVELALPWAALGGRPAPTGWRANLGRERPNGREISSWAPVGGRFANLARWGVWQFGETPQRAEATTSVLLGEVRDRAGRPVSGVPVSSAGGLVRTDALGRFRAAGLPRQKTPLAVASGRYEPFAVEVEPRQPREVVILSGVQAVDPNRFQAAARPSAEGFRVYAASPLDEVDATALPAPETEGAPLRAFAAPGEREPLGALILASRELPEVTVTVTDLTGPGGARLGQEQLELRLVKRILQRVHYSRPPEEALPVSRYLLPATPAPMNGGTLRSVFLTVTVPAQAPPGLYRGQLTVRAGAAQRVLAVEFEVLGIQLGAPARHYAIYYRNPRGQKDAALRRRELEDIRAHGADRILGLARLTYSLDAGQPQVSYEAVIEELELLRSLGFQGPFVVWDGFEQLAALTDGETGPRFRAAAKAALEGLRRLATERGWPELVVTHLDEVFGEGRLDRYLALSSAVRQVPEQRLYITFHSRPQPAVAAMTQRIDPFVEVRCYHGHSLDEWVASGHTWAELGEQLRQAGDEAWCYYNLRGASEPPEWARLTNGYWLWLTPCTTHVPWAYNSWAGDPLDDEDGYDFGYAFPVGDQLIGTRQWEAYREGIDDVRYLSTLERLVTQPAPAQEAAAAAAREWLDRLRGRLTGQPLQPEQSAVVKALSTAFSGADYHAWRREAAGHIARLQQP